MLQWSSSWSLYNPWVSPSRPRWHVRLYLYGLLGILCHHIFIVQGHGNPASAHCTAERPRLLWSGERETLVWCVITANIIRPFGRSTSLWCEDEAYLWSDDGQSALWIMMYDCWEAGEQTSHTSGSFTCERSGCCKSTLSLLCFT